MTLPGRRTFSRTVWITFHWRGTTSSVRYSPLFSVDTRNGDILWGLWIEGFEKAVALRSAAWKKRLDADVDTAAAMSGMRLLADIARGEKEVDDRDSILAAAAPDKIADWIVILNEWRLAPCKTSTQGSSQSRGKRSVATNRAHAAQERNTRNAAASIDRRRGPHRRVTFKQTR